MAQKRTTSRGQVATAPAPSGVPSKPQKVRWIAALANGQAYGFEMTREELEESLDLIWFRPEPGKILIVSGIVMVSEVG